MGPRSNTFGQDYALRRWTHVLPCKAQPARGACTAWLKYFREEACAYYGIHTGDSVISIDGREKTGVGQKSGGVTIAIHARRRGTYICIFNLRRWPALATGGGRNGGPFPTCFHAPEHGHSIGVTPRKAMMPPRC
jgi:hypothetical protein